MKRFLFLSFFVLVFNTLLSQEKLDNASLVCQYEHTYMNDTLKQTFRKDLFILQIGTDISKCYSYYTFQYDSLMSSPEGKKETRKFFNEALSDFKKHWDKAKFLNSFPRLRETACIYKNYPQGKMTVTDFLGGDYVVYEDELNGQDWQITDSVKTILDYNCQQAISHYRGRQWIVWFTPDIPVANGPWKLGGLPGLIMEAYDHGYQYYFRIIGIEKKKDAPIVWSESFSKKRKYISADRKVFLKACKHRIDNNSAFLSAETGVSFDSGKTIHYDLIERDYR